MPSHLIAEEQRSALLSKAAQPSADALRLHPIYRGKIQIAPKCPVRSLADFAIWYTPGVAAPCLDIKARPEAVYAHTNRGNCIAIVSDGSRVLGLGDIGPEAGLPVMEGKALLFKYLGGVDAVPLCLDVADADDIVRVVRAIAPSFGGINLEDIAQPKCFRILDALRAQLSIPVWHDDQQGTATAVLAALLNATAVVGKNLRQCRIAMIGMGAANVATCRLLMSFGVDPAAIVACDSRGTLHRARRDLEASADIAPEKWRICVETNPDAIVGGIAEALRDADICIAFTRSGPGIIRPEWVQAMARDAIVLACANPVPEIWPWDASAAGARIVATGRSDFPNQVNNALVFPGVFRGVLDVRARTISDAMAIAAATELAACVDPAELGTGRILPPLDDWRVAARVAATVGVKAQEEGIAGVTVGREELHESAQAAIHASRAAMNALMDSGAIAPLPGPAAG